MHRAKHASRRSTIRKRSLTDIISFLHFDLQSSHLQNSYREENRKFRVLELNLHDVQRCNTTNSSFGPSHQCFICCRAYCSVGEFTHEYCASFLTSAKSGSKLTAHTPSRHKRLKSGGFTFKCTKVKRLLTLYANVR